MFVHESIGWLGGSADLSQARLTSAGLTYAFVALGQFYSACLEWPQLG